MEGHGGLITRDDLRAYQAKLRPPVHTTFRGFDVYSIGPSSSGGVVLCQMLNILERYDLKADGRESPRTIHRVTEAMRRAFYTRATQLADPDFNVIPVDELTSKAYADKLAQSIGEKATPSQELAPFAVTAAEGDHTTHLSTIDQSGNAVALTYTLEDSYGAKAVVAGAGFLLNNEMGDFNLIPGRTDSTGRIGTTPNQIAPHKRMVSSQTPTLVLKEGRARLVTGSPGGRTIPNTVLWVVLNLIEFVRRTRRGRGQAENASPVVSGRPCSRRAVVARGDPTVAHLDGPQAGGKHASGQCQYDRGRNRRQTARRARPTAHSPRPRPVIERLATRDPGRGTFMGLSRRFS